MARPEIDIVIRMEDSAYSLEKYKDFLSNQKYWDFYCGCSQDINELIEDDDNHGVPMMNIIFYEFFKKNHIPPTWVWFGKEYKRRFVIKSPRNPSCFTFNDGDPKHDYDFTANEINRKIMNAYMSFLKEGYVLHWLWEHGYSYAYYSLQKDYDGFDICVEPYNSPFYGIRVYCFTDKSEEKVAIKDESRIKTLENYVSIKLEVDIRKAYRIMIGPTCIVPDSILTAITNIIKIKGTLPVQVLSSETVDERKMS